MRIIVWMLKQQWNAGKKNYVSFEKRIFKLSTLVLCLYFYTCVYARGFSLDRVTKVAMRARARVSFHTGEYIYS